MKYELLTREDARRLLEVLDDDRDPDIGTFTTQGGNGSTVDLSEFNGVVADILVSQLAKEDPESVEHKFSGEIYLALREVPVEVRDDIGFWRFLTLGPLRPFFLYRAEASKRMELAGTGGNLQDTLALRMFLRGQVSLVEKSGQFDFSLAEAPGIHSHDFWQSHIIRVPTGAQPSLAHSLIQVQHKYHLVTSPHLRNFVRDYVNRPKRLLAAELFSENEARDYLDEQISSYVALHPDALAKKVKSEGKKDRKK